MSPDGLVHGLPRHLHQTHPLPREQDLLRHDEVGDLGHQRPQGPPRLPDDPHTHRLTVGRTGQDLLVRHLAPGRRLHLVPDAGDAQQ